MLSAIALILRNVGAHHDNYFGADDGYLYLFILNNISFTLALYGLLLFFVATEELLEPYRPIPKFLCIKGVIFFSFWQGIALSILLKVGIINDTDGMSANEVSLMIQNLLVCVEMLIASFVHAIAFGYEEYMNDLAEEYTPMKGDMANNIKSILIAEDVIKGVKDSISPKKYDFELKNDN